MNYLLPFFLLLGLFACNQTENKSDQTSTETTDITYKPENYSYREGQCDSTGIGRGVSVRATYTLLDGGAKSVQVINDTLKAYLSNAIVGFLDSAEVANHPEARSDLNTAAKLLASSYRAFQKEFGDTPVGGCWEIEIAGDTLYSSPERLAFRMGTYAYTGGAHPNTLTTFYTFDRKTGQPLQLADLVSDTTQLLTVAEKYFRKAQNLQPTQNLENEGYFLNNGRFFLPQNIAPSRDGLLLYYNPYEIASYAQGPIEFVIPYKEINGKQ